MQQKLLMSAFKNDLIHRYNTIFLNNFQRPKVKSSFLSLLNSNDPISERRTRQIAHNTHITLKAFTAKFQHRIDTIRYCLL